MNVFYCIFEAEPEVENPLIAHVSRAVVHLWVRANEIDAARDSARQFLKSDRWLLTEEKEAYLPTPEQIEGLDAEQSANYQTAQSEGIHAKFYYWHRSE